MALKSGVFICLLLALRMSCNNVMALDGDDGSDGDGSDGGDGHSSITGDVSHTERVSGELNPLEHGHVTRTESFRGSLIFSETLPWHMTRTESLHGDVISSDSKTLPWDLSPLAAFFGTFHEARSLSWDPAQFLRGDSRASKGI